MVMASGAAGSDGSGWSCSATGLKVAAEGELIESAAAGIVEARELNRKSRPAKVLVTIETNNSVRRIITSIVWLQI
jgi:hypothetical protein